MARQFSRNEAIQGAAEGVADSPKDSLRLFSTIAKNRLLLIFCLLALVAVVANIKVIVDLDSGISARNKAHELSLGEKASNSANSSEFTEDLRIRLFVLFGILIASLGSILYLYVTRVLIPLRKAIHATDAMSKGNLSVTAPVGNNNDIGELGAAINELSANFQEVALLTGVAAGNSFAVIEKIEKTLDEESLTPDADLKQQVSAIKRDMQMLCGLVKKFKFYKARFDGLKVKSRGHRVNSSM